jgi:hypothetical protein
MEDENYHERSAPRSALEQHIGTILQILVVGLQIVRAHV